MHMNKHHCLKDDWALGGFFTVYQCIRAFVEWGRLPEMT